MKTEIIKTILFAHFAGQASPLQTQVLRNWLKEANNQETYYACLQEWEQQHPQMITKTEDAYLRLQEKIHKVSDYEVEEYPNPNRFSKRKLLIAAGITGFFFLTAYTLRDYWYQKVYHTANNEIHNITLPDGSLVTLNPNSLLSFPRFQFTYRSREVFLSGHARFNVRHLSDNTKFIVNLADNLSVEVLGTEFTVDGNPNATDVNLITGKIRLSYLADQSNKEMYMEPGDHFRYSHLNKTLSKLNLTEVEQQNDKEWILSNITLLDLSQKIEATFRVKVIIKNEQTASMTVSGIVPTDNLDVLLQSLAHTLNLQIERKNNKIKIL
jgi:transmembrane sensor